MEHLPAFSAIFFGLTTFMTVLFFYRAAHNSKPVLYLLLLWLILQAAVALTGFYTLTDSLPPRFILLVSPALVSIALLFLLPQGRAFIDRLDASVLTLLHLVRIPVELVLFWLFLSGSVPEIMTFEGRNPDILCGLSAPVIYYFVFIRKTAGRKVLFLWNIAGLCLLLNIVAHAVLSAPSPFQQLAFDQPNTAVLHFPYVWLPCCIVPLVLLSHLAVIRQLLQRKTLVP